MRKHISHDWIWMSEEKTKKLALREILFNIEQGGLESQFTNVQYLVCPPSAPMHDVQRRLIERMSVLMLCWGILAHSWFNARISSGRVVGV